MAKQRTPPPSEPAAPTARDIKRKRSRHERVMSDLLFLRIHQSGRTMRDVCRALGYAENDLSRVFNGYKKLEIEVIYEVLAEIEVPALLFFEDFERMLPYERDPEDADLIRTRRVTPERAERFVHKAEGKLFRLFGKDLDREALMALKAELAALDAEDAKKQPTPPSEAPSTPPAAEPAPAAAAAKKPGTTKKKANPTRRRATR